jgi:hypothetical protein
MRDDALLLVDVESALLTGRIDDVYKDDPRGTRYHIAGTAADLTTTIGVVVRFVLHGAVLVITTFVVETGHE